MKLLISALLVLLTVCLLLSNSYAEQPSFFATIHKSDGTKIEIIEFLEPDPGMEGTYNGQRLHIPFSKIRKAEVIGKLICNSQCYAKYRITNDIGEEFIIEDANISSHGGKKCCAIFYNEFNPITREVAKKVFRVPRNMTMITIGDQKNTMKYNPRTGKFYPSNFEFDPITGEELISKDPSEIEPNVNTIEVPEKKSDNPAYVFGTARQYIDEAIKAYEKKDYQKIIDLSEEALIRIQQGTLKATEQEIVYIEHYRAVGIDLLSR